jgi:MarR family transcriptional regulator, organic hydroperoxide resistance regulator
MGPSRASPDRTFLDGFLPHLLARAAQAVGEGFHAELRRRGTTVPVWRVLAALSGSPGETVGALAQACLLHQPTMTKLLDRMERDGLVRRHSDGRDRRIVRVALTPTGQGRAADLMAAAKRHEAELLARYPRVGEIRDLLREIGEQPGQVGAEE